MSEAKLDITGDSSSAQRALDKASKESAKLRETIRQMNEDAKKGFKESSAAMDAWGRGMERMRQQNDKFAQGMANISKQNHAFMMAQKQVIPPMERMRMVMGSVFRATTSQTTALGGLSGKLAASVGGIALVTTAYRGWASEIDKVIERHTDLSHTVTRTLAMSGKLNLGASADAWKGSVAGATPQQAMATLGGVMQSGETLSSDRQFAVAGELAKLAPTGIDMTQTGALGADVADILGGGVSAPDVADATMGVRQMLGEKTGEFQGRKFQKQISALKLGGMSGQDAMAHAIVALQSEYGSEALKVLSDKTGRTADQRKMLKNVFTPEAVASAKGQLAASMTGDMAAGQLSSMGQFPSGREALGEQDVAIDEARTTAQLGPLAAERNRLRRKIATRSFQRSGFQGALNYVASPLGRVADFFMGQEAAGIEDANQGAKSGLLSKSEADEFIAALRAAAAASREVAKSNNKRNVDAHIE